MIIHTVSEGDYLYKIGQMYNVDYQKIADDNEIAVNTPLVVGQTLVIIQNDNIPKTKEIETNGFAFPNIDVEVLKKALPYLTYLSIFSYALDESGNLENINDDQLISLAKSYHTLPVMVVANIGEDGRFDSDLAHQILNKEKAQNTLISQTINLLFEKQYAGLTIDFEYVYPEDRDLYIDFLNKIKRQIEQYNFFLSVAVAPKNSASQTGILYEAHDYNAIGKVADRVIIMTYEWGYSGGPARAVAPVNLISKVLEYAVTEIPSAKIMMGIPNYGYDWTLPYKKGILAKSIGNYEAVDIARRHSQSIHYDKNQQSPYFNYYDDKKTKHEVWFEDAKSINAKLGLILKYNLDGASYWTLNRLFPQNYLVLNSLFDIKKYM